MVETRSNARSTTANVKEEPHQPLPFWNHPIVYLFNLHVLIVLHLFSWWAVIQAAHLQASKTSLNAFLQRSVLTYLPEGLTQNLAPIQSAFYSNILSSNDTKAVTELLQTYLPSGEAVISTSSFLAVPLFGFVVVPLSDYAVQFPSYAMKKWEQWQRQDDQTEIKTNLNLHEQMEFMYHEKQKREIDEQTKPYKLLYRMIPLLYGLNLTLLFWFSMGMIKMLNTEQVILHSLSLGMVLAQSGVVSHELIHKRTWLEQIMGRVILWYHNYLHFHYEHVYSHHKKLATPLDAATARYGETIYRFVVRSSVTGYIHAWEIDSKRRKKYKGVINQWLHSEMMWSTIATIALPCIIAYFYGFKSLISFGISLVVAIFLIEVCFLSYFFLM